MSLASQLGAFVAELDLERVPQRVRTKLRHHALDSLGVIHAGQSAPESRALRAVGPHPAFFNTFCGRIHTFDDTYEAGPIHPGTCVLSAALAAAEESGAAGKRLLEAVLAGYEVSIRVCLAAGAGHYAAGFHPTGTCNAFGAAAAAAHAYGLDARRTAAALALAGEAAAGLRQHQEDGGMTGSALNGARAARTGIEAAQLARAGLAGPEKILEGRFGFFAMMDGQGEQSAIGKDLGIQYRFLETSLKPYPTCRFTHGPIAALRTLRLHARDVESIELAAFRQSVEVSDRPEIRTRSGAILSHQYALALALTRERIALDDLDETVRTNPDLRSLAGRVRVVHDPRLDEQYPARWPHRLTVFSKNQGILRVESDFPPGGPQAPLDEAAVVAKFHALADPVMGSACAEQLRSTVWALESAPRVAGLIGHS
ncbi:MAG: MmgE/PrpD family protein [Betaproteobacteria bacterium]|nr:MmgE/PrpD family protein [Betaproteobacteria bacterium]